MRKVYIKYGDFESEEFEDVYQGLLENNIVKILIPEANYSICQKLAAHWGDEQVFLVGGEEIVDNENGGVVLVNTKVIGELSKNEETKGYYCDDALLWKLDHQPRRKREKIEYEPGFFGYLNKFVDYCNGI